MTSCLVLRYAAPLMAFGHTGRFDDRPSAATPTVSAVQGMVAAAAGISRSEPWPQWIADLHLAVRIDHPGTLVHDYHTVNQPPLRRYLNLSDADLARVRVLADADGKRKSNTTVVSERGYVADATFLLAIGDPTGKAARSLADPIWHLYAGRKSCPLTTPFVLGRVEASPEHAVGQIPTVAHPRERLSTGDTAQRDALVLTEPVDPSPWEVRNDRAAGFRSHRQQPRWRVHVDVPVAADWFDVHTQLNPQETV